MNNNSNYALTDNVNESFTFDLRGKKYVMRYPITEETDKLRDIPARIQEAQDKNDSDEVDRLNNELEQTLYSFITPEGHDTPIKEALAKENIRVMRNFNIMIKTELSIQ